MDAPEIHPMLISPRMPPSIHLFGARSSKRSGHRVVSACNLGGMRGQVTFGWLDLMFAAMANIPVEDVMPVRDWIGHPYALQLLGTVFGYLVTSSPAP